jgi:hypothetical protein
MYMSINGLALTGAYRDDFNGRTCLLADQGRLKDATKIHAIRKRRNSLAHDASQSCRWEELDNAVNDGHPELQHLGIVGRRPDYKFFGEGSGPRASTRGAEYAQDFVYGLKEDGKRVVAVSWSVDFGEKTGEG